MHCGLQCGRSNTETVDVVQTHWLGVNTLMCRVLTRPPSPTAIIIIHATAIHTPTHMCTPANNPRPCPVDVIKWASGAPHLVRTRPFSCDYPATQLFGARAHELMCVIACRTLRLSVVVVVVVR